MDFTTIRGYGWGTIGNTSMHHAFAGMFEKNKPPICDPAKRGGRVIRTLDPDKLCGKCRRLLESVPAKTA